MKEKKMPKNKSQIAFIVINYLFFIFFILIFISVCAFKTHVKGIEPFARPIENDNFEVIEISEAQSSSFHLLGLFPVTIPADYDTAIEEAINNKGGDNLIDVRYWHEKQYWLVGTVDILHVKGKVIQYRE